MSKKLTEAEKIYAEFASLKNGFRHESLLPGDKEQIVEKIEEALQGEPVKFLMFWGQGDRDYAARPEEMAVEFMAKAMSTISETTDGGIHLDVVFTDSHIKFNGFVVSTAYRDEVDALFEKAFTDMNASYNVQNMTSVVSYTPTPDGGSYQEYADFIANAPSIELDPKLERELVFSAHKHFTSDPDVPKEVVARAYFLMNEHENGQLAEAFPDHVFLTYNNKKHEFVIPEGMPAFFMHSLDKTTSVKPWFTDERVLEPATLAAEPEVAAEGIPTSELSGARRA